MMRAMHEFNCGADGSIVRIPNYPALRVLECQEILKIEATTKEFEVQKNLPFERKATLAASTSSMNESSTMISDSSEILPSFCQSIETILRQGLKRGLANIGLAERDYWNVIQDLPKSKRVVNRPSHTICHLITLVQQNKKVRSATARGRQFIRFALAKRALTDTLQCLLSNEEYVKYWYSDCSLLTDYEEKGVLLDVIKSLKKKTYKLNPDNCSFLHETWITPEIQYFEFVPCAFLGLTLFTVANKCIIIGVKENSVAEEKGITIGDCLDQLFGEVIDERTSTKIGQIRKKNQGKPVTVTIIKGRYKDGRWFSPLFKRYSILVSNGKCIETNETNHKKIQNDHDKVSAKHSFNLVYLGAADVGNKGNCIYVQDGMQKLNESGKFDNRSMKLQLLERDIALLIPDTGETVMKFSYTETSSCALCDKNESRFGFITGNTTCSFADVFKCHVFECASPQMARQIIDGIGKGFDRTVYCV